MRAPTLVPVPGHGAEDVVVDADGAAYTGTEDGAIWRISADLARVDQVADTGGRPLGLELDGEGRLVVCDGRRGLLRVDPDSGAVEVLTDRVEGLPMVFCNNAAVAEDGTVWFSDSSRLFAIDDWRGDIVMATRTGRLLRRDPDGTVTTVVDGLDFANGVALAADGSYVAVAESGACTVVRHRLTGPEAGSRDVLRLPGYPDNIARGSDGLIWVTIASPPHALATRIRSGPGWLRRFAARVPTRLQPQPSRSARVQAYDDAGRLVHDLELASATYAFITGVREHRGRLWLSSLHEPALAYLDL